MRSALLYVIASQWWLFVAVLHAEAAAQVQVLDLDALAGRVVDQCEQAVEGIEERWQRGQLQADMAIDADHLPGSAALRRGRRRPAHR